jgi:hypothetical protein
MSLSARSLCSLFGPTRGSDTRASATVGWLKVSRPSHSARTPHPELRLVGFAMNAIGAFPALAVNDDSEARQKWNLPREVEADALTQVGHTSTLHQPDPPVAQPPNRPATRPASRTATHEATHPPPPTHTTTEAPKHPFSLAACKQQTPIR